MNRLTNWMDSTLYPEFEERWDQILFREKVQNYLKESTVVLDFGAGRGSNANLNLREKAGRVCGVDLDPAVTTNPYLDEGVVLCDGKIPYPDNYFDLVVSRDVLEHLERPAESFAEIARVLKPGGHFLAKTPNKFHYVPLLARLTPHRFHEFINSIRGRERHDTFPTFYRANTKADVRRWARKSGMELVALERIEGRPEYLRMHPALYAVGALYERTVNSCSALEGLRVVFISDLKKPN